VYNLETNPPKVAGICDESGERLIQRDDDRPDAVRHRLEVYDKQTMPLKQYYEEKGHLLTINGMKGIEEVFENIIQGLAISCKVGYQSGQFKQA
jgi:adenylate kinase